MTLAHAAPIWARHGMDSSIVQGPPTDMAELVHLLAGAGRGGRHRKVRVRQQKTMPQGHPEEDVVHAI
eukprot:4374317-Prorocentrum_lima.AAC.1